MKNLVIGMLLLSSFGLDAADASALKRKVNFVSDERNKIHDQFSKHLDKEYYGELPFGGEYASEVGLRELMAELKEEYYVLIKLELEALLALDYLDLEEEETLNKMSIADGLHSSLYFYRTKLQKGIDRHDEKTKESCAGLKAAGKDVDVLVSHAENLKDVARGLSQKFLTMMEQLESFRTPR